MVKNIILDMKENQDNIDFIPKVVNDELVINDNPWPSFLDEPEVEQDSQVKSMMAKKVTKVKSMMAKKSTK